jgi:hypothetical protein
MTMKKFRFIVLTVFGLFFFLASPVYAYSIGASDDPNNPAITTFHNLGDFIGSNPDPFEISYDSNAGRWIKKLMTPAQDPMYSQWPPSANAYYIVEFLQVSGTQNWIGWHEEIITPGWEFLNDGTNNTDFLAPYFSPSQKPPGYQMDFSASSVTFTFDPISPAPGLIINPAFSVMHIGSGYSEFLEIAAYPIAGSQAPVPEPTTMLLLGSGFAGLAGLRIKFIKR